MTINDRKKRWNSFYNLSSDTKTLALIDCPHPDRPWPYPENMTKRLDWATESYHKQLSNMEWLHDDRIPALNPYTGTELFAAAFGCKVHYSGDNMPFALPMIHNSNELSKVKEPDLFNSCLGDIFELGQRLRQRGGRDAVLHIPDIQSPFDIASLVWDKGDLFMAMMDAPEAVCELIAMTERTLIKFLDAWFKEFGTEYISHYPDYYMHGGVTVSEDEIGAFSPAMFKIFCLPSLNRLSKRYGGIGIHCCAHARHQWNNWCKVDGLRMLNFVQSADVTHEAYRFFANKTPMMHYWCGEGSPDITWAKNYPTDCHVVLSCESIDYKDAIEKCKILREIAAQR